MDAAEELEQQQKLQFAKLLLKRPKDALLVAAEVLGRQRTLEQPLAVIAVAETWPSDSIVLAEMEKIKNTPITANEQVIGLQNAAETMLKVGEYEAYHKTMRLIAEITGAIKKKDDDDRGKGNGKLHELIAAIEGPLPDVISVQP